MSNKEATKAQIFRGSYKVASGQAGKADRRRINIMTSCDERLAMYILPQLVSIGVNLAGYDVHFYLAHSRIPANDVRILKNFAAKQRCITFHEAKAENTFFFESLVESGGGQWPQEAYYTLRAQDYLPADVDRVMYIDAGDVIIDGDIAPYYFDDFDGCSIIATPVSFKTNPATNEAELYTGDDVLAVARGGIFNSGSYVIDVDKFRREGYTADDYLYLAYALREKTPSEDLAFFGDQGFLAAAFAGDIKIFGWPSVKDPMYMPYNFRTSYWSQYKVKDGPPYKPVVIHYAIASKPWVVRFPERYIDEVVDKPDFVSNYLVAHIGEIVFMTAQHLRLCELWWEYAKKTPIYQEADMAARVTANSWIEHFLPLCKEHNELTIKYFSELRVES